MKIIVQRMCYSLVKNMSVKTFETCLYLTETVREPERVRLSAGNRKAEKRQANVFCFFLPELSTYVSHEIGQALEMLTAVQKPF